MYQITWHPSDGPGATCSPVYPPSVAAKVLVLAGTSEATELARRLHQPGVDVVSSLAGVTTAAVARPGVVRAGGFGGADGLADYLRAERFDAVVDATHPFAAVMPFNVAAAASRTRVPHLRLLRPPWSRRDGDRWIDVPGMEAAAAALDPAGAQRVFLATGRQQIDVFRRCTGQWFLVRSIEPVAAPLPRSVEIRDRGPFTVAGERRLFVEHAIDTLVAKNAGGTATMAKLDVARELGVPVVLVARPPQPPGVQVVTTVDAALAWLEPVTRLA
jgi:precorrin-6A/cobalt-precorrin-6A reductase